MMRLMPAMKYPLILILFALFGCKKPENMMPTETVKQSHVQYGRASCETRLQEKLDSLQLESRAGLYRAQEDGGCTHFWKYDNRAIDKSTSAGDVVNLDYGCTYCSETFFLMARIDFPDSSFSMTWAYEKGILQEFWVGHY